MTKKEMLKNKLKAEGIPQWRLAKEVGVHENTLSRQLRYEPTDERFEELSAAIDGIVKGNKNE